MNDNEKVVLVKRAGVDGPVRLDRSEYEANPGAFELWDESATPTVPAPATKATYFVKKAGKIFLIVDAAGLEVVADGVETAGYASEDAAWIAIAELLKGK